MQGCKTCALVARRDRGEAPLWDEILRTPLWDVVHNYETSLPGWLVLVVRRHLSAIDELTQEEAVELGLLLQRTSKALKEVVGCEKTYVLQFAEHPEHPHVHFHVVPRMKDMPADYHATGVFGYSSPAEGRVSEAAMNALAVRLHPLLTNRIH